MNRYQQNSELPDQDKMSRKPSKSKFHNSTVNIFPCRCTFQKFSSSDVRKIVSEEQWTPARRNKSLESMLIKSTVYRYHSIRKTEAVKKHKKVLKINRQWQTKSFSRKRMEKGHKKFLHINLWGSTSGGYIPTYFSTVDYHAHTPPKVN